MYKQARYNSYLLLFVVSIHNTNVLTKPSIHNTNVLTKPSIHNTNVLTKPAVALFCMGNDAYKTCIFDLISLCSP